MYRLDQFGYFRRLGRMGNLKDIYIYIYYVSYQKTKKKILTPVKSSLIVQNLPHLGMHVIKGINCTNNRTFTSIRLSFVIFHFALDVCS